MSRTDLVISISFFALGGYVTLTSIALPAGVGRLPGPGFFPEIIGGLMILLALVLLKHSIVSGSRDTIQIENKAVVAGVIGLILLYLLFWGTGAFALRTTIFLVLLTRFLGETWKRSVIVAVILTSMILLGFLYGLRLNLE